MLTEKRRVGPFKTKWIKDRTSAYQNFVVIATDLIKGYCVLRWAYNRKHLLFKKDWRINKRTIPISEFNRVFEELLRGKNAN
jgi:hypothetical protein